MLNMIFKNDITSPKVNTAAPWSHRGPLEHNPEPVYIVRVSHLVASGFLRCLYKKLKTPALTVSVLWALPAGWKMCTRDHEFTSFKLIIFSFHQIFFKQIYWHFHNPSTHS